MYIIHIYTYIYVFIYNFVHRLWTDFGSNLERFWIALGSKMKPPWPSNSTKSPKLYRKSDFEVQKMLFLSDLGTKIKWKWPEIASPHCNPHMSLRYTYSYTHTDTHKTHQKSHAFFNTDYCDLIEQDSEKYTANQTVIIPARHPLLGEDKFWFLV